MSAASVLTLEDYVSLSVFAVGDRSCPAHLVV